MNYLLSVTLILISLSGSIEAKTFTYDQIHSMPVSVEKDYYIWRFLTQQSTTSSQSKSIIKEVKELNEKLRTAYRNKTGLTAKAYKRKPAREATEAQKQAWRDKVNGKSFESYFDKAIDFLQKGNKKTAIQYFEKARLLSKKRHQEDQATFWLYQTTGEKRYLNHLLKSWDINLYTLIARDQMHIKYPRTITPKLPKKDLTHYNEQNPIDWANIKLRLFDPSTNLSTLANNYKAEESVGVYTYIQTQASHEKNIYYPMPYRNLMAQLPKSRQALIYAIARQESRFVPASVSRSFALGMMQIMPFLVKHIANERGESIDLDEMFDPQKAIIYANHHLNYLKSYLYNPLFVAYAYNGGIGFTRRMIEKNNCFRAGSYEPYISMETVSNPEAREYGKKVLVNYVIYLNKLGISTRITPFIQELTDPSSTDKFRS
ncbi:MAG: lytic transglycosylase domain-containing protein [Campylobacterota bacterium]|nr:lytic transglycosylase domain-containing protein [Campylobacterota bacterium]